MLLYLVRLKVSPLSLLTYIQVVRMSPFNQPRHDTRVIGYIHTALSTIDERLIDDPSRSPVDEAVAIWQHFCKYRSIRQDCFFVFFNKCDLLKGKLNDGLQVKDHVKGYVDRPNRYEDVRQCMHHCFWPLVN